MEKVFEASDKIGDIVAQMPKASEVFKKYKVDFCCGGNRELSAVLREQNIDQGKLLSELEKTYMETKKLKDDSIDWTKAPLSELIDYIVNTHHAYLQDTLPTLSDLTVTVLRAHGTNHDELSKVHKLFHTLKMDLEQHLITEEEVLFPLIKRYENTGEREFLNDAVKVIEKLENEHEGAGDILKELRKITEDYKMPEDACPTYERTYKIMKELESDIFEHIHLENNILHPRVMKEIRH